MYIDKRSPVPAYYQLRNIILEKIKSGEYSSGNPIPSERELSEKLNISRMTVRQAINQLVAENILYREKGRGTFVSRSKFEQKNIMSFSDLVKKRGLVPNTKVLRFEIVEPPLDVKEMLELDSNDSIYYLKRLRIASDIPVGIEEDFIPERYCPGLDEYDLTTSLYKILEEKYHHTISYVDNVIEAFMPRSEIQKLLHISKDVPVISITGTSYTVSGVKLIYEKSIYRSDEYKYNVRVFNNRETI